MVLSIEIDTKLLKSLEINISQFIFVSILFNKTTANKIASYLKDNCLSEKDFSDLISKSILTEDSELSSTESMKLTKEFIKKLKEFNKTDYFEDFLLLYPAYVIRPDGLKSYIRNNPKKCEQLYKQLVGNNKDKHAHLLKCLQYEVNDREINGNLKYMLTMNNWLQREGWQYAEERMKDKSTVTISYGEAVL